MHCSGRRGRCTRRAARARGLRVRARPLPGHPPLRLGAFPQPPKVQVIHREQGTAPGLLFITPSSGPGRRGVLVVDDTGRAGLVPATRAHVATTNFRAGLYHGAPGALLVGGDDDARPRRRRPRDRRQHLPRDRPLPGRRRAGCRPPRADPHSSGDGARDRVGPEEERGRRCRPGARDPERRVLFEWRSLDHVPDERDLRRASGRGSTTSTSTRSTSTRRATCWSRRAIRGLCTGSSRPSGKVDLAARREEERLRAREGRPLRLAARRARAVGDDRAHAVRQRATAPAGGAADTRPRARARREEAAGDARSAPTRTEPSRAARTCSGASRRRGTETCSSAGAQARCSPSTRPSGRVLFDATLPHGGQSYRALRFPWVGRPAARPALAASDGPAVRELERDDRDAVRGGCSRAPSTGDARSGG